MTGGQGFVIPAEHLVLGRHGPEVRLSARVCAALNRYANLDQFRQQQRGRDAEVDAALLAMHFAATEWRRSATGTPQATPPEPATSSQWVGTRAAATQLRITERAVVKAIQEQRLPASKVDGRWRINREDIAHHKNRRTP